MRHRLYVHLHPPLQCQNLKLPPTRPSELVAGVAESVLPVKPPYKTGLAEALPLFSEPMRQVPSC